MKLWRDFSLGVGLFMTLATQWHNFSMMGRGVAIKMMIFRSRIIASSTLQHSYCRQLSTIDHIAYHCPGSDPLRVFQESPLIILSLFVWVGSYPFFMLRRPLLSMLPNIAFNTLCRSGKATGMRPWS